MNRKKILDELIRNIGSDIDAVEEITASGSPFLAVAAGWDDFDPDVKPTGGKTGSSRKTKDKQTEGDTKPAPTRKQQPRGNKAATLVEDEDEEEEETPPKRRQAAAPVFVEDDEDEDDEDHDEDEDEDEDEDDEDDEDHDEDEDTVLDVNEDADDLPEYMADPNESVEIKRSEVLFTDLQRIANSKPRPTNLKEVQSASAKLHRLYDRIFNVLPKEIEAVSQDEDLDDADRKHYHQTLTSLRARAYEAYQDAEKYLKKVVKTTFPEPLKDFGQNLYGILSDKLDGLFDEDESSYDMLVTTSEDGTELQYIFRLHLKDLTTSDGFVNPDYIIVLTASILLIEDEDEAEELVTYYVTRLTDAHKRVGYRLGRPFRSAKQLLNIVNEIMGIDGIRTVLDRVTLPGDAKSLRKALPKAGLVNKLEVDHDRDIIRLTFVKAINQDNIREAVSQVLLDFGQKILGEKGSRNHQLRYSIRKTDPYVVDVVIVHRERDTQEGEDRKINRNILADLKTRYGLSDQKVAELSKFLITGN